MASNTHVDSRVAERRLRPIYDWLGSGNYKKALQESDKVLRKHPNFLCAKVLKALALQRLGRESECEKILESVCSEVPTDEATLQGITVCYRAIHKPQKICEVYLAASKKDPTNEELLTHLFMSYVRVGDYRKQHQHAMSLYKLRPKNPYYFWAVMSVVMQAKRDENIERDVALKLAEKMVSKFITEGKIEAEQEVQLYLMILEMQGKYEEALDVIEGELGEKLKSLVTTSAKRIELLMKLERWKDANVLLKCQLEKNPDSWSDYKNYLETMFKIYNEYQKTKANDSDIKDAFDNRVYVLIGESIVWQEADFTPKMVQDFLIHLIKKVESEKRKIRGPYLAQLELYKCMKSKSLDPEEVVGDITDLLVKYFDRFGDKAICVLDLKPYLSLMNIDEASLFMKRITEIVGLGDGESPRNLSSLQKHICRLQLSRVLGFHSLLTVEERLRLCDLILHHYQASNELVRPDKLPTQFSCNDPYIVLLSHILFSVYQDANCKKHIIRAIYHLENALSSSPSNFHFKIHLVKFYLMLGAGQQAYHFYEHLEVKYIQLDSLGFFITFSLYGLGSFSAATSLYDTTLKFFSGNTNDSVDHLTYAYKYGSFMKIEEFIECHNRLNESIVYTFCTVENMLHYVLSTSNYAQSESAMKSMEIKPGIDKINWTKLRDNRDLNVFLSYEPENKQLNSRTVERTFENLKSYVRLRVLILKSLSAVFDFVSDNPNDSNSDDKCIQNGSSECPKTVLTNLVSELKCLYEELNSQDLDEGIQDIINCPPPCRLKTFLKIPVHHIISDMTDIILQMDDKIPEKSEEVCCQSESVSQTVRTVTDRCISQFDSDSVERRELLETIVGVVEMLSITAILCGNLHSLIKRSRKNQRKGKRKKEETDGFDFQIGKNVLGKVSECIRDLDDALNKSNEKNEVSDMSSEVKALTINDGDVGVQFVVVEKKLRESYSASIQEIRQFLQEKQAYVTALKAGENDIKHNSRIMDNSQYICFCRRVFPDQTAFKSHLPCTDLVNAVNRKAKFDIIPPMPNEVRLIPRALRPKSESVIKIMKLTEVVPETRQVNEKLVPTVTAHVGKRLPSRTKVPYLSRAVPLSTDHSFERCTCGAVFVTRMGKRQHQARFCKLGKNSKNKINSDLENMVKIQTVSPSELANEYLENEGSVINDISDEQSVIHYEVHDNCVV